MSNVLTKAVNKVGGFIVEKSPTILLVLGIGGCISATVIAVKETPKAVKLLEERKKELEVEKLDVKEVVKTTWKLYLPVVVTGGLAVACVIASHGISERRKAALATAYTIAETSMLEYRDRVKKEIGEQKEFEIQDQVNEKIEEKFGDILDDQKPRIISPMTWIKEPCTGQEFYNSEANVREIINDLNESMVNGDNYITVNDYLDALGLNESETFGDWEWHIFNSGQIRVHFPDYVKNNDGSPLLLMKLRSFPRPPIKYGD